MLLQRFVCKTNLRSTTVLYLQLRFSLPLHLTLQQIHNGSFELPLNLLLNVINLPKALVIEPQAKATAF